jgi:hypothetical protein
MAKLGVGDSQGYGALQAFFSIIQFIGGLLSGMNPDLQVIMAPISG